MQVLRKEAGDMTELPCINCGKFHSSREGCEMPKPEPREGE